jgi:NitT/TauT family transport system permease protein
VRWLRPSRWFPAVVAFAALILAWKLLANHDHYLLPQPGATLSQLWDDPGLYLHNAWATLGEALIGLGFGFGAAFLLSVLMSQIAIVERALLPLAVALNVTPVVAVAPALVVAFGFGPTPKIIVTAVIVFFPALINSLVGLRSADPEVLDVLRSLDAARWEVLWHVRLPSALPFLFAAARVCLPLSVVGAVVAEFVTPGSSAGLGTLITQAYNDSQLSRIYAAVICLAVMGVALTLIITVLERWVLAWEPSRRRA